MVKTILLIALGILAVFIVITLIRAAFFKSEAPVSEEFADEAVNSDRAQKNLMLLKLKRFHTPMTVKRIGANLKNSTNFLKPPIRLCTKI